MPKCAACDHPPHPNGVCNTGGCDCATHQGAAASTAIELGAVASHSTATSDGTWDSGAAEKACPAEPGPLRAAHAWVDPDGDPAAKTSYKFVHHEVSASGDVGAANLTACSTGIGVLNGGRGGTTIPKADYDGVYAHLARHLKDGGREPPAKSYTTTGTAQLAKANQPPAPPAADPTTGTPYKRWRMPVAVLEGVLTGDRRRIAPEALTWRDLPQPLMALTKTTAGHDEAELVGRIDAARRVDASSMTDSRTGRPYGKGAYAVELSGVFTSEETAARIANLIEGRFLRGVSVDLSDVEAEVEYVDTDDRASDADPDIVDVLFGDEEMVETITAGRIMGATACPFPAFEGAYIELVDDQGNAGPATQPARPTAVEQRSGLRVHSEFVSRECEPCTQGRPLVAGGGPQYPPGEWFDDPRLDGPTPLTVLDSGRVFGHLALWGSCHTGFTGRCVQPPHSVTGYALYRTGAVKTAEGDIVPVGPVTIDTSHAGLHASTSAVLRHYENTGTAVADVSAGEDDHGVWLAGALRPDVTEAQVRSLRASAPSGDWRDWGGNLELLAVLAVNAPGFPVVRQLVAGGAARALVAAGSGALRQPRTVSADLHELIAYLPELVALRQARHRVAKAKMTAARRSAVRDRLGRALKA